MPFSATPAWSSFLQAGICGYYAMISMTLNVFRAQILEDAALPFAEPK